MAAVTDSIAETVHAVNDAHYAGRPLPKNERLEAARTIAARQGLPGAYAGSFAGFEDEVASIRVYTGERIESASARHILGEECCRALRLLDVKDRDVAAALASAEAGLLGAIGRAHPGFAASSPNARTLNPGLFCCGKCTVAMWRTLAAGGLDRQEERLARGVAHLVTRRDGTGKWHRFPFWYTVLALVDIAASPFAPPDARRELSVARPHLEHLLKRSKNPPPATPYYRDRVRRADPCAARRHDLAQRCLSLL